MSGRSSRKGRKGVVGVVVVMIASLVLAGVTRTGAAWLREEDTPAAQAGGSTLGRLDSFALGLLLGGLRGPLVMALWTSSDAQRTAGDLSDIDTKIELIRLLQPQFDSVHLYQIWNKAYNLAAELGNAAGRYAAVLDAVEYANEVNAERPNNIDIETMLGEVYARRLGAGEEKEYYSRRVHEETQARQPVVRIEFPAARESELREAALEAGVAPNELLVRPAEEAGRLVTLLQQDAATRVQSQFDGEGVSVRTLPPPATTPDEGRPQRLPPMLTADGELLPELTAPRRERPEDVPAEAFLDGSDFQFLPELGPFPEGLSPFALAYEHFRKAYVLQEYAGQRHVTAGEGSISANPGRALRDWAIEAFEEGRQLEAEAFGRDPPPRTLEGDLQAELETVAANVPLDADPASEALLRRALTRYARSQQVGARAIEWLDRHLEDYPEQTNIFGSNIDRLELMITMLAADELYAKMILGEAPESAQQEAAELYRRADALARDYILRYDGLYVLPPDTNLRELDEVPVDVKEAAYRELQRLRTESPLTFEHARDLNEFDGYRERAATRLQLLEQA